MSNVRIAINGLGRIGRCVARALVEHNIEGIDLVAVNGPAPTPTHLHLLKYDSVHGRFNGHLAANGDRMQLGRHDFPVLHERDLSRIDWAAHGVDVVLECTGHFTARSDAEQHLAQGAKKVLISAPAKETDVKTIVYGVNHAQLTPQDHIISIGSCTTNCLAPVAKVLNDSFGIESGFMTTIHAYTGDQNLVDGSHKDLRRARAAGLSIVPSTTGAAKALGLVLPELVGKLDGTALRVPTPNVSMVDLVFHSRAELSKAAINQALMEAACGPMHGVLAVNDEPCVSIDFTHTPQSSIVDAHGTFVTGKHLGRVAAWYDNEWGFSCRMLDLAKLAGTML
ncbi:MAG: type I glyceraldehyde-3-phosphate dehydrogenase [Rickettsiales bacterium]|nr:type I glyceraldehyde-3-phosphate dehydrogenase [Rickettsiales bacterium]